MLFWLPFEQKKNIVSGGECFIFARSFNIFLFLSLPLHIFLKRHIFICNLFYIMRCCCCCCCCCDCCNFLLPESTWELGRWFCANNIINFECIGCVLLRLNLMCSCMYVCVCECAVFFCAHNNFRFSLRMNWNERARMRYACAHCVWLTVNEHTHTSHSTHLQQLHINRSILSHRG